MFVCVCMCCLLLDKWLDENLPLYKQGVEDGDTVGIALRFYGNIIDHDDRVLVHMLYIDALASVINGIHRLTNGEIVSFGALQLFIENGMHGPKLTIDKLS